MKELKRLEDQNVSFVNITPNNNEIHIKYQNDKTLVIGSDSGPVMYAIASPKMELLEKGYVFEEELAVLLNKETVKAIDDITTNVFKISTDHKKATLLALCTSSTPEVVKDMLKYLSELHIFFNQRTN